jgi:hypothetical protein
MSPASQRQEVVYDKNTPLESVFRNSIARILDFLILNQNFDYSPAEISRITGIPLRTVQRAIPHLIQKGIAKESRPVGNTTMYMLNPNSPLVAVFLEYVKAAINVNIDKTAKAKLAE